VMRIRRGVAAVKRYMGPTGVIRFDAPRTEQGHADEFWALALLVAAATNSRAYMPAAFGAVGGDTVTGALMARVF
jgi:hypothetical protein